MVNFHCLDFDFDFAQGVKKQFFQQSHFSIHTYCKDFVAIELGNVLLICPREKSRISNDTLRIFPGFVLRHDNIAKRTVLPGERIHRQYNLTL